MTSHLSAASRSAPPHRVSCSVRHLSPRWGGWNRVKEDMDSALPLGFLLPLPRADPVIPTCLHWNVNSKQKHPKCLLVGEWGGKHSRHAVECYLVITGNQVMAPLQTKHLENTEPRDGCLSQKTNCVWLQNLFVWIFDYLAAFLLFKNQFSSRTWNLSVENKTIHGTQKVETDQRAISQGLLDKPYLSSAIWPCLILFFETGSHYGALTDLELVM